MTRLAHPLPGSTATGSFGWRPAFTENGVYVPAMLHNGQDYGAPTGTPIRAAHSGRIIWSGWDPVGGGWGIQLQHDDGWSTLYFHMSHRSTDVTIGQRVTTGQTIGRVGMSGLATGPHLHFMLRINGQDLDPVPYLTSTPAPLEPMGEIMSYYKTKKAFRDDLMHLIRYSVPRAKFNAGIKDAKGKVIIENLASSLRRAHTIGRQNRIKNDRMEGKIDALGVAIQQLSGGQIDMAAIEKAAFDGAAKGAADVEAHEVAELLQLSVKQDETDEEEIEVLLNLDSDDATDQTND